MSPLGAEVNFLVTPYLDILNAACLKQAGVSPSGGTGYTWEGDLVGDSPEPTVHGPIPLRNRPPRPLLKQFSQLDGA